jgi:hypothetical protein
MAGTARVILLQAPFLQLNAPYPAIAYLSGFLSCIGVEHEARDLSIEVSRALYSRRGLERIFADAETALRGDRLEREGPNEKSQLLRYLSNAASYVSSIDAVVDYLSGRDDGFERLLLEPSRLPWGMRVESYLNGAEGEADPLMSASLILEDIADFISYTLDGSYSLARYAESLASSQGRYAEIRKALDGSYIVREFVRPIAREALMSFARGKAAGEGKERLLACASVPFPGALLPSLAVLEEAKALGMETAMGGGYVSTELRWIAAPGFFKSVDYLCFDSGYGALESLVRGGEGRRFRTMRLSADGKGISVEGFPPALAGEYSDNPIWNFSPREDETEMSALEADRASKVFPDYGFARSDRYLRIREDGNPMKNLWSAGKWLKCRLAYGCYWAKCSFCDCSLDYISSYRPAKPGALHAAMLAQARRFGTRGVHLIDEAAPVPLLLDFALENARAGRPLSFWGNGRFESAFTPDRAEFLSWAGMLAFSAGIESASDAGLALAGKGLSLADVVCACAALSGAGILVHAYMIHGLPGEDDAGAIDSLDALRQMFAEGIVSSAFYHRFVLTRHSPFASRASLPPRDGDFAFNDLPADDRTRDARMEALGEGMDRAVAAFMEGEGLDAPIRSWFDLPVPRPRNPRGLVKSLIAGGPRKKPPEPGRAVFLGGSIERDGARTVWAYRNGLESLPLGSREAERLRGVLEAARPSNPALPRPEEVLAELRGLRCSDGTESDALVGALRSGGLLFI